MLVTRDELDLLLGNATAEGWARVADEKPPVGERVEVMHCLSRSYDTTGHIDEAGQWCCCNGFLLPGGHAGVLTFHPTHWRLPQGDAA